jgi:hypothetical protein
LRSSGRLCQPEPPVVIGAERAVPLILARHLAWRDRPHSFDPDYLEAAMRGTDAILLVLNQLCGRRSLIAPNVARTAVHLAVVKCDKTGT